MNEFVKKSVDNLKIEYDDPKVATGFIVNDDKNEKVILILGINPAGYEESAEFERNGNIFLGYVDGKHDDIKNRVNNTYYGGIHRFLSEIVPSYKFEWCNKDFTEIEKQLGCISEEAITLVRNFYDNHKESDYTVYLGDLFYYHSTAFSKFKPLISLKDDGKKYTYAVDMLKLHIEELKKHNKQISFVYVNNAEASNYFQKGTVKTFEYIDEVPVFYGGMLSGQHSMDNTSKMRLINEIKAELKIT